MAIKLIDYVLNSSTILEEYFLSIRDFIWNAEIFFLYVYAFLIITLFFALIVGMLYLPVWLAPYYRENKKVIDKIIFFDKK